MEKEKISSHPVAQAFYGARPRQIGEVQVTSTEGPSYKQLSDKWGDVDVTPEQRKALLEAKQRDESKVTLQEQFERNKRMEAFNDRVK